MGLDKYIRRNAQRFPQKTAMQIGTVSMDWRTFDERVTRLANGFRDAGLSRGDHIAVLAGNCIEYFEIYFACARYGTVAVPLNFRLTAAEIQAVLGQSPPALLLYAAEYSDVVAQLRSLLPKIGRSVCLDGAVPDTQYSDLLSEDTTVNGDESPDEDTLAIFYTSGTTGLPKGAMVSHRNLEMNGYNQMIADGSSANDINLVATPIYHMGAVFMAITYIMQGSTQVILPAFSPASWLQTLEQSRATVSLLIPTMINAVLHDDAIASTDLSRLRLIFYGGGPMPPAVLQRAIEHLGCGFTQGYGLTETLEATFLTRDDHVLDGTAEQTRRLASAGREAVGAEIKIVDDTGAELPCGEVGEIIVRSESVISGYFNNPAETRKAIRDGWFFTGDLGYLDDARYLFVVDRKKDMVVSGGVNIYTKEIEELLYQHEAIVEAAVFALPDEHWGEIVSAAVVVDSAASLDEARIQDYCRANLASYKVPKRVLFCLELPKNPSGKILKRELRESYAREA